MASNRDREIRRPFPGSYDASQREQTDALLRDLGADEIVIESVSTRIEDEEVQSVVSRLRTFAEENPRIVLGALSALIAGGAIVAGRAVAKKRSTPKRAASSSSGSTSGSKSGGSSSKGGGSSSSKQSSSTKGGGGKSSKKRASSKRTLIEPHPGDKRYIRRDARGRIKESDDVSRSLSADQRQKSKTKSKPGQGDKGDR